VGDGHRLRVSRQTLKMSSSKISAHGRVLFSCILIVAAGAVPNGAAQATPIEATVGAPTPSPTPEAPFGLTWLASKEDTAALVGPLEKPMSTDFGDSYVVSRLPKDLTDLHYAVLSFDSEDRLIRVTAIGGAFQEDHSGARIKARYAELRTLLQNKYGEGKSVDHADPAYLDNGWGLGLHLKKNWMVTLFEPPDLRIELSVFEEGARTNWRMIFEHTPSMQRLEQERKESEKEAL